MYRFGAVAPSDQLGRGARSDSGHGSLLVCSLKQTLTSKVWLRIRSTDRVPDGSGIRLVVRAA